MENEESGILGTDSEAVSRENAATRTTGLGEPHDVPDEGDEVRVYVFAGQARRGVDSLVSRRPRLERLRADEKVVEVRRRRYRTRTGRYVLEFEVRRVPTGDTSLPTETMG
jgi:hypothetical protein